MSPTLARLTAAAAAAAVALAIDNGKGVTPPMGWCVQRARARARVLCARAPWRRGRRSCASVRVRAH